MFTASFCTGQKLKAKIISKEQQLSCYIKDRYGYHDHRHFAGEGNVGGFVLMEIHTGKNSCYTLCSSVMWSWYSNGCQELACAERGPCVEPWAGPSPYLALDFLRCRVPGWTNSVLLPFIQGFHSNKQNPNTFWLPLAFPVPSPPPAHPRKSSSNPAWSFSWLLPDSTDVNNGQLEHYLYSEWLSTSLKSFQGISYAILKGDNGKDSVFGRYIFNKQ